MVLQKKNSLKNFIYENKGFFIFCFVYFAMMLVFFNSIHFCDESDNFLGGLMVADGKDVYKIFRSQHMPFAYYFFAIPALLGIKTISGFRISFYIMLIIIWAVMYFRYKEKYGKLLILLYPIFYICTMSYYYLTASAAVSDQFQAQGLVILLIEFLIFIENRKLITKIL